MKRKQLKVSPKLIILIITSVAFVLIMCERTVTINNTELGGLSDKGLNPELISAKNFLEGIAPENFKQLSGANYKPSYNEDPAIPPQCWIETGYGTQNACKYCHTDYLAAIEHGNNFPIGEDQILYSFPTANLNRILWRNILFPQEIEKRLRSEGISLPNFNEVNYIRKDNWRKAFYKARSNGNSNWLNKDTENKNWILFPSLNPDDLFPYNAENPTDNGTHGYIDNDGFVKNKDDQFTGWRAINFFPYAIFTPLTGSVSGVYIRLPEEFMMNDGELDILTYKRNLNLLENNIKNQDPEQKYYYGDASHIEVKKGFYPLNTEFAHPLHYVDLKADGSAGMESEAVVGNSGKDYSFPGTRSKRVKEIRYMYKWKDVDLADLGDDEEEEEEEEVYETFIGKENQGWVDNGRGWIVAGYIEDRKGNLRPQTTEELAQCVGCHGNVGNTVDAIWSFQRKLPGELGWKEMDYGKYDPDSTIFTKLQDYRYENSGMGEFGYFLYTVVGADLYGVMPKEIKDELIIYAEKNNLTEELELQHSLKSIFDDEAKKYYGEIDRKSRLLEAQKIMRHYVENAAYLYYDETDEKHYIKGNIFYPTFNTMKNNIFQYRKIVLDQTYNLGKDVFGGLNDQVPFTFRSDGNVKDEHNKIIPAGKVITSRPYDEEGVGTTPTGIVSVNKEGEVVDSEGNVVDIEAEPEKAEDHISSGGTFDMMYNPILSGRPFSPRK